VSCDGPNAYFLIDNIDVNGIIGVCIGNMSKGMKWKKDLREKEKKKHGCLLGCMLKVQDGFRHLIIIIITIKWTKK